MCAVWWLQRRADEQCTHLLQQAQENTGEECAGDGAQTAHNHDDQCAEAEACACGGIDGVELGQQRAGDTGQSNALPIVAVLMFGLGALIQSTLITPSLKTKSFTNLLFLTVGLGLLLTNGALVIFGSTYYKIITPYSQTYIPLGPVTIALPRLVSFLILIVVAIALFAFLPF